MPTILRLASIRCDLLLYVLIFVSSLKSNKSIFFRRSKNNVYIYLNMYWTDTNLVLSVMVFLVPIWVIWSTIELDWQQSWPFCSINIFDNMTHKFSLRMKFLDSSLHPWHVITSAVFFVKVIYHHQYNLTSTQDYLELWNPFRHRSHQYYSNPNQYCW